MATSAYDKAVKFHGHSCPGLAIGYRIAVAARRELNAGFSADEEVVCMAENNSCSVDAVQVITGCTAGKGNLLIENIGKQAFSFYARATGKALRVYYHRSARDAKLAAQITEAVKNKMAQHKLAALKAKRVEGILTEPEENILKIGPVQKPLPQAASIHNSLPCGKCGELTMETMLAEENGLKLCPFCREHAG